MFPAGMTRFARLAAVTMGLTMAAAGAVAAADAESLPPALYGTNPRRLSGGLFSALDGQGAFGVRPAPPRARDDAPADLSKGTPPAVLDARVGPNIRVGNDPAALPGTQRGQAEPHLVRSIANPDVLLATFQEGRFALGDGALDCGFGLSRDGGLTWTRALVPLLTQTSGGFYFRATDPVAAVGPQGDLYINTLAAVNSAFTVGAVVVSRSTDQGATWSAPSIAFQAPNSTVVPDKNWLAVNDYPATTSSGRLIATWTNFTATSANLLAAVSDDRGTTWSAPVAITPNGAFNQGSLPLFLPDGSLVVIYATFPNATAVTPFTIQCKRSADGGRTFPAGATTVASSVLLWDDLDVRIGAFLPAAAVARQTGEIFVCYAALIGGSPRVLVAKSSDQGSSWSASVVVSDNPASVSVDNPAIAVTPDGQTVSVVFMDKRNSPLSADGHSYSIDHYAAQSFDGGATWQSNLRLTEMNSDVRFAPLTSEGYMLGDYLAVAPSLASDQPCVAIWCETRTGDADPFTARFVPVATSGFEPWRVARFSRAELADNSKSGATADFDNDGVANLVEYDAATNPRVAESGETLVLSRPTANLLDLACVGRADSVSPPNFGAGELAAVLPDPGAPQPVPDPILIPTPGAGTAPAVALPAGLVWRVAQVAGVAGRAMGASRGATYSVPGTSENGQASPVTLVQFASSHESATNNTTARLVNISTRGDVRSGPDQLIVGFAIDGQKSILVRAGGPALVPLDVPGTLADPQLTVASNDPAFVSVTNDDWQQDPSATAALYSRLGAYPFSPFSPNAALLRTLDARSYTATAVGAGGATGIALVEIYDADPVPGAPTRPRLVRLAASGHVGTGDSVLITGFVIGGTQRRRVLLRAIGPSQALSDTGSMLADPVLTLYRGSTPLAVNDDWELSRSAAAIAAVTQRLGATPLNHGSLDAALLVTLWPGPYTVVVAGANGGTGLARVEVYDAD